jgi:hypothetical protein
MIVINMFRTNKSNQKRDKRTSKGSGRTAKQKAASNRRKGKKKN